MEYTQLILIEKNKLTVKQKEFMEIDEKIAYHGQMVSNHFIEYCKELKEMRDKKAYIEAGYQTFDEYAEKRWGMKTRNVYNFISVIEKLPREYLEERVSLGITKLLALTQINSGEREELESNVNLEEISSRELQAKIQEIKNKEEQINCLENEKDELQATAKTEMENIKIELEKLKAEKDVLIVEIDKRSDEKAKELAQAEKLKYDEELKRSEKIAKTNLENVLNQSEKYYKELEALKKAKNEDKELTVAIERANKLEKELKIAGNSYTLKFVILFNEMQSYFNKIKDVFSQMDIEERGKSVNALKAGLKDMEGKI